MPEFDFETWDNRAFAQSERVASKVQQLFDAIIKDASQLALSSSVTGDGLFSFDSNPALKKKADKLFKKLAKELEDTIEIGYGYAFDIADQKNTALIKSLAKATRILAADLGLDNPRNITALSAFQNRKDNGLGLSDRVWKITQQSQSEIELAIDLGLSKGTSAAALSRSVRQSLSNPDTLFRRIRDKRGNLALSKAAKLYNPGRGVYRSSAKNALRLTRTETNMAYREADFQRWQSLNFVVGIEVRLSNNRNHCPTCEALAGQYPKDFKFIGWHPQCRCNAIPIMLTDKEFNELQQKLLNDEPIDEVSSENQVDDINNDAKQWFEDNKKRIKAAASIPYFIRDNQKYY